MAETSLIGARKENVLIQAGTCVVRFAPQLGGKIASIQVGGTEILQTPLQPPAPRTKTMGFDESDASGWDECLPSVAACTVKTAAGDAHIPDHGDLWRVAWEAIDGAGQEAGDSDRQTENGNGQRGTSATNSLKLRGRCFSLPLELERSVELTESHSRWRLNLGYMLRNVGDFVVPWSWAAHPLFLAGAGDRILLPKALKSLRIEGSGGQRLGKSGDMVSWPLAELAAGGQTDLSLGQNSGSGIGDKLFAGPLEADQNWCVLERPSAGLRIKVTFDVAATPYLGLWICYGGWPERAGAKQTCVALEPATAPVDSLAVNGPWTRHLAPGEWSSWSMGVEIESL